MTRKYGEEGLPEDTIYINAKGTAGQSFGAFVNSGITFDVERRCKRLLWNRTLLDGNLYSTHQKNSTFDADNTCTLLGMWHLWSLLVEKLYLWYCWREIIV